ncbi:uncharacterized protein EV154DRAFT_604597 [Mucor mucedo]|uniref:uncharacterized protein n=1 Tax=Mucor mucedo TaxID=29922 RepID=UPI00221E6808|nr:uncharacterized protein EV154DRAFT_604597 [Mucor mucedo]KAI7888646.1 hypothetical protein EV154DRAFT_604597 [Mucor mucedo]
MIIDHLHNDLPASLKEDVDLLKDIDNAETLKKKLDKEEACPAQGDMMRQVGRFIDTAFDDPKIICRGSEKASKSLSASLKHGQNCLAEVEKMENVRLWAGSNLPIFNSPEIAAVNGVDLRIRQKNFDTNFCDSSAGYICRIHHNQKDNCDQQVKQTTVNQDMNVIHKANKLYYQ